jgi:hypothetical protein
VSTTTLVAELFQRRRHLIALIGEERLEAELGRAREVLTAARRDGESKAATALRVVDEELPEPSTASRRVAVNVYLLAALTSPKPLTAKTHLTARTQP